MGSRVILSESEWRRRLSPERYRVLRGRSTERPFTGAYWDCESTGVYHCGGCDTPLFHSKAKRPTHAGWPIFGEAISQERVALTLAERFGKLKTEVSCATCGSHLGYQHYEVEHPAGLAFQLNSAALKLERQPGEETREAESESAPSAREEEEFTGLPF